MTQIQLTMINAREWAVHGPLTFNTVKVIFTTSQRLWENSKEIIVNLESVEQVDSAALALLVEWQNYAAKKRKKISFNHCPEQLIKLIKVSHLEDLLL